MPAAPALGSAIPRSGAPRPGPGRVPPRGVSVASGFFDNVPDGSSMMRDDPTPAPPTRTRTDSGSWLDTPSTGGGFFENIPDGSSMRRDTPPASPPRNEPLLPARARTDSGSWLDTPSTGGGGGGFFDSVPDGSSLRSGGGGGRSYPPRPGVVRSGPDPDPHPYAQPHRLRVVVGHPRLRRGLLRQRPRRFVYA